MAFEDHFKKKQKDPRIEPIYMPKLAHKDAFMLYKYMNPETLGVEWVWNSRDGVMPYGMRSETGIMNHVDWHEDLFAPNFVPPIGMRIAANKENYDRDKDDFNLVILVVDQEIHDKFGHKAGFNPWIPPVESKIIKPSRGRYA